MSRFDDLARHLEGNDDALRLVSGMEDEIDELTKEVSRLEAENFELTKEVRDLEKDNEQLHEVSDGIEMQRELLTALADSKNWTDGRFTPVETKFQLWDVDQLADRALRGVL